jgi:hypothetical protein
MRSLPRSGVGVQKDNAAAIVAVSDWLHAQDKYLFTRQHAATRAGALQRTYEIGDVVIQQAWDHFHKFRGRWQSPSSPVYDRKNLQERSNYYALAAAALAREKFVLTGIAQGHDFELSQRASWGVLDDYVERLNSRQEKLPTRVLIGRVSVAEVVEGYAGPGTYGKIAPTFITLAGCAMTALAEQAGYNQGAMVIPETSVIVPMH